MTRIFNEKKLLIASTNKGKIREIQELFRDFPIEFASLDDFNLEEPEENGLTFCANAEIKAQYYGKHTNLPSLADDSGLVIPALGGQPGVYSARWCGSGRDFAVAIERVRTELFSANGGAYEIDDEASFICALTLYWPDGHFETFEGRVKGHLQFPSRGDKGFGYDPIFVPENHKLTFAEMDGEEKHQISHRADAFRKLIAGCFNKQALRA